MTRLVLPRSMDLRDADPMPSIIARLRDFSRDVVAALRRRPETLYRDVTFVGGDTDVDVLTGLRERPHAVSVAYVRDIDANAAITSAVWAHWEWNAGSVRLRNVSGLTASTRYLLRIEVRYG